jgi:hypothetical protein
MIKYVLAIGLLAAAIVGVSGGAWAIFGQGRTAQVSIGVSAPAHPIGITPTTGSLVDNSPVGSPIAAVVVAMSDGAPFNGSLTMVDGTGIVCGVSPCAVSNSLVTARTMSAVDDGAHTLRLSASANGQVFTQAFTLTVTSPAPSSVCAGSSPDPNAVADGFTSPVWCFDFTQSQPSNLFNCATFGGGNFIYHAGWPYSGGNAGDVNQQTSPCNQYGLAIDPIDGKQSFRMHWIPNDPNDDNSNGYGQAIFSNGSIPIGWFQVTFREDSSPKPPSPQDITPGSASPLMWAQSTTTYETDLTENFSLEGDCLNSDRLIPHGPCHHLIDWSQYNTLAQRVTYDGTNIGNTYYINGQVVTSSYPGCSNCTFETFGAGTVNWTTAGWNFVNQMHWCGAGSGHCQNTLITSAAQCTDGSGATCVTFGNTVDGRTYQGGKVSMMGMPPGCPQVAYITGATGITAINGLHAVCGTDPVGNPGGGNPTHTAKIQDLPWPGGTYNANSAIWNPMTDESAYIRSIAFWSCPGFDPFNGNNVHCSMPNGAAAHAGPP